MSSASAIPPYSDRRYGHNAANAEWCHWSVVIPPLMIMFWAIVGQSMNHDSYPDSYIRGILNSVKTIAMVGISPKDNRPSYFAFKYLQERGYRMIPVNPGQAGKTILGQKV